MKMARLGLMCFIVRLDRVSPLRRNITFTIMHLDGTITTETLALYVGREAGGNAYRYIINDGGTFSLGNSHTTPITGDIGADIADFISGANGFYGNAGDDTINGYGGVDTLYGGAGDDIIRGGALGDILAGGAGRDTLTGGAGADGFVLDFTTPNTAQADVVTDFTRGEDYIIIDLQTDDLSLRPYTFTLADTTTECFPKIRSR